VIPPLGADAGAGAPLVVTEPVEQMPASNPLAVPARDPRMIARKPRSRALLLTELAGLERLLDVTKKNAPDRPGLIRRVAETHSELAFTSSGAEAAKSRDEAIRHFTTLMDDYPNYPQRDENLYYLGLAHEMNGNLPHARKTYYELIKSAPQSRFIPFAYFAFGEMFFNEARRDPSKWDLANQAFMEVIKYPAPGNAVFADTLLRLGEVSVEKGDQNKAKQMFDRLRREFPDSGAVQKIPSGF